MTRPATDLSGLLRPDGSVVVPPSIAREVLRAIVRDTTQRVRAHGGEIPPATRRLLFALHESAQRDDTEALAAQQGSASGTPPERSATVDLLTVAEAAERLECSPRYVRRLARSERITARRTAAGWLIDPVSLDHYRRGGTDSARTA